MKVFARFVAVIIIIGVVISLVMQSLVLLVLLSFLNDAIEFGPGVIAALIFVGLELLLLCFAVSFFRNPTKLKAFILLVFYGISIWIELPEISWWPIVMSVFLIIHMIIYKQPPKEATEEEKLITIFAATQKPQTWVQYPPQQPPMYPPYS